jgi:hypothetical protein
MLVEAGARRGPYEIVGPSGFQVILNRTSLLDAK